MPGRGSRGGDSECGRSADSVAAEKEAREGLCEEMTCNQSFELPQVTFRRGLWEGTSEGHTAA